MIRTISFAAAGLTLLCYTTPARAQITPHDAHDHEHGMHTTAPMASGEAPHGGQIQHTGARTYELVHRDDMAKLYLYTHSMEPVALQTPHAHPRLRTNTQPNAHKGAKAGGSAVFTTADGQQHEATLEARRHKPTDTTYLYAEIPDEARSFVHVTYTVRVYGAEPDTVVFESPADGPKHREHESGHGGAH